MSQWVSNGNDSTEWRGGGWAGYGPIPSVVLMQNPTAAPYPEEKKTLSSHHLPHIQSTVAHVCMGGLVGYPLSSPTASLCPTERCTVPLPAPRCTSSFIAPACLAWARRKGPGRRPRGLLPLSFLGTREAGTLGSGWAQATFSGVILGLVG